jgi:DNA-directed RNA polymerase subunit M/transcription elongation factor TFIIS
MDAPLFGVPSPNFHQPHCRRRLWAAETRHPRRRFTMAKIAKTADRKKIMDTTKSTDCPKCGKPTRIVKRVKDRERNTPGGIFISCSGCEFHEKL